MRNFSISLLHISSAVGSPEFIGDSRLCISHSSFYRHVKPVIFTNTQCAMISYSSFKCSLSSSIVFDSSTNYYGTTFNASGLYITSSASVDHCSFINLTSSGSGAAINITSVTCSASITNCNFYGCVSHSSGGSIYALCSTFSIAFCCFEAGGITISTNGGGIYVSSSTTSTIISFCSSYKCPSSSYNSISSVFTIGSTNVETNNANISQTVVQGSGLGIEHFCSGQNNCSFLIQCNSSDGSIMSVGYSSNAIAQNGAFINNTQVSGLFWMTQTSFTASNFIFSNTGSITAILYSGPISLTFYNCAFDTAQLSLTTVVNASFKSCSYAQNGLTMPKYSMIRTANCRGMYGTPSIAFTNKLSTKSNSILLNIFLAIAYTD